MLFIERCKDAAGSEKKRLNVPLLSIRDLSIDFKSDVGAFRAVDGLSFDVPKGKTVALVGESGSGKSVTAQAILRSCRRSPASAADRSCSTIRRTASRRSTSRRSIAESETMRALRGGRIAMIFQEPMTSLSPLHTIGDQVSEALLLHGNVGKAEALDRPVDVFARVGFPDPKRALTTYPFELSGGLRQRAMIAMALITRPALLIADEPTTALDVTTQAQILDLMQASCRARRGMSRSAHHPRPRRRRQRGRRGRGDVSRPGRWRPGRARTSSGARSTPISRP